MAKKFLLFLVFSLLLTLCSTACCDTVEPTGYAAGEIDQPQVMYNGQIYYYWATGFNEPLPADYNYVGCVDKINNLVEPIEDFSGCRLSKGQRIYANPDNDSVIYLQYEDGFARFSISLITEEAKKENT